MRVAYRTLVSKFRLLAKWRTFQTSAMSVQRSFSRDFFLSFCTYVSKGGQRAKKQKTGASENQQGGFIGDTQGRLRVPVLRKNN